MSWYYNSVNGAIVELTGVAAAAMNAEIAVMKHDPIPGQIVWGPYSTREGALAAKAAHPASIAPEPVHIPNPLSTIGADVQAMFVRALEAIAGIVLLAIAANIILKELTGIDAAGTARRVGTKAAIAAAA